MARRYLTARPDIPASFFFLDLTLSLTRSTSEIRVSPHHHHLLTLARSLPSPPPTSCMDMRLLPFLICSANRQAHHPPLRLHRSSHSHSLFSRVSSSLPYEQHPRSIKSIAALYLFLTTPFQSRLRFAEERVGIQGQESTNLHLANISQSTLHAAQSAPTGILQRVGAPLRPPCNRFALVGFRHGKGKRSPTSVRYVLPTFRAPSLTLTRHEKRKGADNKQEHYS